MAIGRQVKQLVREREAEKERLINERCACGHARMTHADTVGGLARGHGHCFVNRCECEKFTWIASR